MSKKVEFDRRTFMRGAGLAGFGLFLSTFVDLNAEAQDTATPTPNPETDLNSMIFYKGLDTMKLSKDRQRNPLSVEDKQRIAVLAKELGATHLTIDTPYDDSTGTDVIQDATEWAEAIHGAGLHASHRHMFMKFEAIYDQQRDPNQDFIGDMRQWMIDHADLIHDGDTWTPMPEPQNTGIQGINCGEGCMFATIEEFNDFIRRLVEVSRQTLAELGKNNVEVICCGFDLFIGVGNNNPNHQRRTFLEPATLETLGIVGFDHYPQPHYETGERRTYEEDLDQLEETLPDTPYILTEMGQLNTSEDEPERESVESMFAAFREHALNGNLKGVFWWPFNPGSTDEGLLNDDFTPRDIYYAVQAGFASLPERVSRS